MLYSMSVVWLIMMSEVVGQIFESPYPTKLSSLSFILLIFTRPYNMSPLTVGLLYLAPFLGGILGSAITGLLSDMIMRRMTRRNGGIFEPEFRLVMVIPVALATVLGLWGFGWAAWEEDVWIAPTVFFGIIGFGCTLGSTVSISFVVDSYRADAGSSLTSLNFSKNLLGIPPPPSPVPRANSGRLRLFVVYE